MGFWLAMTGCSLILPIIMLTIGALWRENPPEQINWAYGYRTSMAMKNQDTWDFAQAHCSKVWRRVGWIMLPFSIVGMILVFGKSEGTVGVATVILEAVECVALILSMIPTELALKKYFDREGNRRV